MRDAIVSVLMSPYFCYRIDLGRATGAVGDARAAVRLSRLRAGEPPELLPLVEHARRRAAGARGRRRSAEAGTCFARRSRRMLKDDRARGLATEFGGNWLDFRRFEEHNTVDRERFPDFTNELREAMFEEPIRFIGDVIRNDRPVLDLLYGDYTFVNPVLARHYGMPESTGGPDDWVRVDDARDYQRGGLLPMAVFLTQNAPGLRTSPVKRGYWVARRVLGEVIPPPPPVVPELPNDEAKLDLPLREVLAQHRSNPACAVVSCAVRCVWTDARRTTGRSAKRGRRIWPDMPVDTQATFPGGSQGAGLSGLQAYIRANREKDFLDNFSRKLLVYALGRSLLLSDEPLIQRMNTRLAANGYRISALIEAIVTSPQFLNRRTTMLSEQKGGELDGLIVERCFAAWASRCACRGWIPSRRSRRHRRARRSRSA